MMDNKPVILMVDDTPANLEVLFELLNEAGFRVLVAEDGESALQRAEYACPDLILLDVLMPGMDGFSTCRMLKQQPSTQDIPLIFMSALSDTMDKIKGFQLGAVDYITKPFQHEEVLARVKAHLTIQQLKIKLQENEERLSRIFESAMDAIITMDKDTHITLFNSAAEQMFRCSAEEAIGQPFNNFMSAGLRQVLDDYRQRKITGKAVAKAMWVPENLCALRANGEKFSIEATLSQVEAAGQQLYTFILRDIEERRRTEAEQSRLRGMTLYLEEEVRATHDIEDLVGESQSLKSVMQNVRQVAATDATALIMGETGTGKELIARAIHTLSPLKDNPLVKLNCAAIPAGLVESELFGHEKGAFTGALSRKIGRFELADGGTIFLDEIGELPLDIQAKLLRVLQEGELERVGGSRTFTIKARIIAATNRDLERCVSEGKFRSDLFYRLNVFPIELPPLRERKEDIPVLVKHFVHKYAARFNKKIEVIPERIMVALLAYAWPGNIRELQHVIERAVILSQASQLELGDWFRTSTSQPSRVATLEDVERAHILDVLEITGWRVSGRRGAAQLLGLKSTTLESRMKKLGIRRQRH